LAIQGGPLTPVDCTRILDCHFRPDPKHRADASLRERKLVISWADHEALDARSSQRDGDKGGEHQERSERNKEQNEDN
jgi:hypothetical protein